jgi:hypothetical protein
LGLIVPRQGWPSLGSGSRNQVVQLQRIRTGQFVLLRPFRQHQRLDETAKKMMIAHFLVPEAGLEPATP